MKQSTLDAIEDCFVVFSKGDEITLRRINIGRLSEHKKMINGMLSSGYSILGRASSSEIELILKEKKQLTGNLRCKPLLI